MAAACPYSAKQEQYIKDKLKVYIKDPALVSFDLVKYMYDFYQMRLYNKSSPEVAYVLTSFIPTILRMLSGVDRDVALKIAPMYEQLITIEKNILADSEYIKKIIEISKEEKPLIEEKPISKLIPVHLIVDPLTSDKELIKSGISKGLLGVDIDAKGLDPREFTNHSGGAEGADIQWDTIGREFGVINNVHYWMNKKTPHGNKEITEEDTVEGQQKVTIAARQMGRIEATHQVRNEKLIRNWSQVKYSDAVFAITPMLNIGDPMDHGKTALIKQGKGGTGYAIQMAINEGKPVYVFDPVRKQWFKNIDNKWSKSEIPVLTKNFAGIGSRDVAETKPYHEAGIQAIREVYEKTFGKPTTQQVQDSDKVVSSIPQNKVSGVDSFGSLVTANDAAIKSLGKAPHSIDMIEAGIRTRTTRSVGEMGKYAIKVGDIIKHFGKSADGTTKNILARVTAIHPKGTPGWKGTWTKEGWRDEDITAIDKFKDGAAAIEFELITTPTVSGDLFDKSLPKINVYSTDKNGYEGLSNLLNGPVTETVNGKKNTFKTVEHAYQVKKALFAGDKDAANKIFKSATGWDAQSLGGKKGIIKWTQNTPAQWEDISSQELEKSIRLAFEQNPKSKVLLLQTGNSELTHKTKFTLGKWEKDFPTILMKIRQELSQSFQVSSGQDLALGISDVKVISEAYGVVVAETNPSEALTQQIIDVIQPQIQNQAYRENVSSTANDMFMYGYRWTRASKARVPLNNRSYANKGLPITDAKSKDSYVYDTVDQNGNSLPPVSDLQIIIDEMQKVLGRDMSDYDSVIGNIYLPGQNISTHRDTTESLSARNYPVLVYTIGNDSGITIYENEKNPGSASFASDIKTTIPTKNGSIYTFGMDGKGRFEVAHDTPKNIKRDVKFPPITMPDGTVITNYTITLTFRRAADLDSATPNAPAKIGIVAPTLTTEQPKNIETLEDLESQAFAIIKSKKGDDKYIFLNSQKGLFKDELDTDDKKGERLKGKNYKGIDIVADYFTSKAIKDKSGTDTVDILFVDNKEDAQKQFDNYIKGGAKQFTHIKFNTREIDVSEVVDIFTGEELTDIRESIDVIISVVLDRADHAKALRYDQLVKDINEDLIAYKATEIESAKEALREGLIQKIKENDQYSTLFQSDDAVITKFVDTTLTQGEPVKELGRSTGIMRTKKGLNAIYTRVLSIINNDINTLEKEYQTLYSGKTLSKSGAIEAATLLNIIKTLHKVSKNYANTPDDYSKSTKGIVAYHRAKSDFLTKEEKDAKLDDDIPTIRFDKKGNEDSVRDRAIGSIVDLMRSLLVHDNNGKIVKNRLRYPKLVSTNDSFYYLTVLLQNNIGADDIIDRLMRVRNDKSTIGNIANQVLTKIGSNYSKNQANQLLWSSFITTFSNTEILIRVAKVLLGPNGIAKYTSTVAGYADTKAEEAFDDYFQNTNTGKFIKKDADGNNYLDLNAFANEYYDSRKENMARTIMANPYQFFLDMGVNLTDNVAIRENLKKLMKNAKLFNEIIGMIYNIDGLRQIQNLPSLISAATGDQKTNLVNTLNQLTEKYKKFTPLVTDYYKVVQDKGTVRIALRELEIKYNNKPSSLMMFTAEGEVAFPNSQNSGLFNEINSINRSNTLAQLAALPGMKKYGVENIMLKGNYILNSIFDKNGNKRRDEHGNHVKLNIDNYNGLEVTPEGQDSIGLDSYSLSSTDRLMMDLHTFYIYGNTASIQHGDKKSTYLMTVGNNLMTDKRGKYYIDPIEFVEPKNTEIPAGWLQKIQPIIMSQLQREFNRVLLMKSIENAPKAEREASIYYQTRVANGERYSKVGQEFTIFSDILNKDNIDKLQNSDIFKGITHIDNLVDFLIENDSLLHDQIVLNLQQYFNDKSRNFVSETNSKISNMNKFFHFDVTKSMTKQLIEKKIETKNSPADVILKSFWINNWLNNFEIVNMFYGDPVQYDHAKNEFTKRTSSIASTKDNPRDDQGYVDYINDSDILSSYINSDHTFNGNRAKALINSKFTGTWNSAVMKDPVITSIYYNYLVKDLTAELLSKDKNLNKKSAKKIAEDKLSAYKDMKEADAQGWITLPAYRILSESIGGKWSSAQNELYKRIVSGEDVDTDTVIEYFPVLKMQMAGPLDLPGIPIMAFHKFSLMPLLPNVIKDAKVKAMHDRMIEQNIHYVVFKSGSKLSNLAPVDQKANDFYTDIESRTTDFNNPEYNFVVNPISAKFFGMQVATNSKYKRDVTFSTQLKSLANVGLIENGLPTDFKRGLSFEKRKVLWLGFDETEKRENSRNYRLSQQYLDTLHNLVSTLTEELLEEFGLSETDTGYEIVDKKKYSNLFKKIRESLTDKDLAEYEIKGIKEGVDLSLVQDPIAIEKILMSIINKRIIKPKLKGEALVLVSTSGTEDIAAHVPNFKKPTQEDLDKYGTDGLAFYRRGKDRTLAMKVKIALQGDYKKLLDHPDVVALAEVKGITTLQALNLKIKDEEWLDIDDHRQMITMVGVRIPVQGPNSMEFMEVFEFLPESAGNIIIAPSEIVAKSGGDFDIDKLTILMATITKEGKLLKGGKGSRGIQNQLMQDIVNILSISENFSSLYLPNGTYLLDYLAKGKRDEDGNVIPGEEGLQEYTRTYDIRDNYVRDRNGNIVKTTKGISPTRILEYEYNEFTRESNNIGKDALSIGASENVINVAFNTIGMYVEPTMVITGGTLLHNKLLLRHTHREDVDAIGLGSLYDIDDMNSIPEVISQAMNGWVDIAKDQWIFDLQGNKFVAPALIFLIQAGVPIEQAIYFISQPIIREYIINKQNAATLLSHLYYDEATYGKNNVSTKFWEQEQNARYKMYTKYRDKFSVYEFSTPQRDNRGNLRFDKEGNQLMYPPMSVNVKFNPNEEDGFRQEPNMSWIMRNYEEGVQNAYEGITDPFPTKELEDNIKKPKVDKNGNPIVKQKDVDMLIHFMKIEDMTQGIAKLKANTKFDTAYNAVFLDVLMAKAGLEQLDDAKYIPDGMAEAFIKQTPRGSANIGDLAIKMFGKNLMSFRNNDVLLNYINDLLQNKVALKNILDKKGKIKRTNNSNIIKTETLFNDDDQAYSALINGIVPFLFQNIIASTNLDTDLYKSFSVVNATENQIKIEKSSSVRTGAWVKKNTIYINKAILARQYRDKSYIRRNADNLNTITDPLGYRLASFDSNKYFNDEHQYIKFVIEREVLRSIYSTKESYENDYMFNKIFKNYLELNKSLKEPKTENQISNLAYERFLRDKALQNTFNYEYLFKSSYSYARRFMEIKFIFSSMKKDTYDDTQYSIFDALNIDKIDTNPFREVGREDYVYLLKLTNPKLTSDEVADYNSQLSRLRDPNVVKVDDPNLNKHISDFFKSFDIVAFIQSGQESKGKHSLGRLIANSPVVHDILNEPLKEFKKKLNPGAIDVYIRQFMEVYGRNKFRTRYSIKNWRLADTKAINQILNTKIKDVAPVGPITSNADTGKYYIKSEATETLVKNYVWPEGTIPVYDGTYSPNNPTSFKDPSTYLSESKHPVGKIRGRKGQGPYAINTEKGFEAFKKLIDADIQILVDTPGIKLFSLMGYGQELISIPKTGETAKFNQLAFDYLSKRLFEVFGYQNRSYYLADISPKIIDQFIPVSDQDVRDFISSCYKS